MLGALRNNYTLLYDDLAENLLFRLKEHNALLRAAAVQVGLLSSELDGAGSPTVTSSKCVLLHGAIEELARGAGFSSNIVRLRETCYLLGPRVLGH